MNDNSKVVNGIKSEKVAEAYADWIAKKDWNYFVTFTTKYPMSLKSARRGMERYVGKLRRLDREYHKQASNLFWVAEKFECKDGYHTHGLLSSEQEFDTLRNVYQVTSGARKNDEYFRIQLSKYDRERAGAKYCAKYIFKQCSDYDLMITSNYDRRTY
jgi:hypothetical protein